MDMLNLEQLFMKKLRSLTSEDLLRRLEDAQPTGFGEIIDERSVFAHLEQCGFVKYFTVTNKKTDQANVG